MTENTFRHVTCKNEKSLENTVSRNPGLVEVVASNVNTLEELLQRWSKRSLWQLRGHAHVRHVTHVMEANHMLESDF